jgi:hypothetical protein
MKVDLVKLFSKSSFKSLPLFVMATFSYASIYAETCPQRSAIRLQVSPDSIYLGKYRAGIWESQGNYLTSPEEYEETIGKLIRVKVWGNSPPSYSDGCVYQKISMMGLKSELRMLPSTFFPASPILNTGNLWNGLTCDLSAFSLSTADPNYCPFTLGDAVTLTLDVSANPFDAH